MRSLRRCAPILGSIAIIALFLKTPSLFGCKVCTSTNAYLPLFGAAYFATLIAGAWLFPRFPSQQLARAGLVFALVLGAALTYVDYPKICALCLIAHTCHILMWGIWAFVPAAQEEDRGTVGKRVSLWIAAPVCTAALFMVSSLAFKETPPGLKVGHKAPPFTAHTTLGNNVDCTRSKVILNFITPGCPYCEEQLQMLKDVAPKLACRFIVITSALPSYAVPNVEWVVDPEERLSGLFQVSGYPTLFVIEKGKIAQIIMGVPDTFENL